jgi:hypothetical protein
VNYADDRFETIRIELDRLREEIDAINAQPFSSRIDISTVQAALDVIAASEREQQQTIQ